MANCFPGSKAKGRGSTGEAGGSNLAQRPAMTITQNLSKNQSIVNAEKSQEISGKRRKTADPNLAKVGVEGSNPFARSKLLQEISALKQGRREAALRFSRLRSSIQKM